LPPLTRTPDTCCLFPPMVTHQVLVTLQLCCLFPPIVTHQILKCCPPTSHTHTHNTPPPPRSPSTASAPPPSTSWWATAAPRATAAGSPAWRSAPSAGASTSCGDTWRPWDTPSWGTASEAGLGGQEVERGGGANLRGRGGDCGGRQVSEAGGQGAFIRSFVHSVIQSFSHGVDTCRYPK
jgi:hypothetical protein